MKKKLIVLLFCLVFVMALMTTAVFAEAPAEAYDGMTMHTVAESPYDVWVNGQNFTTGKLTIPCGSGTATFNPTARTLTLEGAQITEPYVYDEYGVRATFIRSMAALTVNVIGDCSISDPLMKITDADIYGFDCDGDITITGPGNLDILLGQPYTDTKKTYAFNPDHDLCIDMSGNFTAEAYMGITSSGSIEIAGSGDVSFLTKSTIFSTLYGSVTFANEGAVTMECYAYGYGIDCALDVILSGSGPVSIKAPSAAVQLGGQGSITGVDGTGSKLLLNGTGDPIELSSTKEKAVYNRAVGTSPVAGTKLADYTVEGDPAGAFVSYRKTFFVTFLLNLKPEETDIGTVTCSPKGPYTPGTKVTLTATPAEGYHHNGGWAEPISDGEPLVFDGNTFIMPNYDVTIITGFDQHTWGTGAVTTPATCTTDGLMTYTCTCGATKTEVIPATGHAWGLWTSISDTQHRRVCGNDASHVETADHAFTDSVCVDCGYTKSYTLTFKSNGGSVIGSITDTYGKTIDLDTFAPIKDGYDFVGWYSDSALTTPVHSLKITGDQTVYAKWLIILNFTDVTPADGSYEDIAFVYDNGLMQGTSPDTFDPELSASRGMIVTILWRLDGRPVVDYTMTFEDVKPGRWYTEAIRWAQANGIINGYSAEKFGVHDPVTREQLAVILFRYAKLRGYDVSARADLSTFTDSDKVSHWAADAVAWANANDLINGVSATELAPKGYATRAQVAAILRRFCEKIIK